jgi:hypothetical protein
MPIPKREKDEQTDVFLSRCIKQMSNEYPREQAYMICKEQLSKQKMETSEEIFVLSPKKSENRGKYLQRCSSHSKMREQFPSMKDRRGACLNAFNSYYKYWSRLEEFGSEEHPDVKFEGCMSQQKASGKDYKEAYSLCMGELIVEPVSMEDMGTNIGDCISKRMKEDSSLTKEEAKKRCSASVVVQPSGGSNPSVVGTSVTMGDECPPSTLDIPLNIENRQKCIDQAHYGPLDPNLPNEDYWKKKAEQFNTTPDKAKKALCGNCSFFIQTKEILDCIAQGLGDVGNDPYDSIKAGDLGYCEAYDFKCASSRTCDAWVVGGPIVD